MGKGDSKGKTARDFRAKAEERLRKIGAGDYPFASKDPLVLVHELTVHQIELEMQNEELRRSHLEADELRQRFQDLFDFAPMGYVILDENDRIVSGNLAASNLLLEERRVLAGRTMVEFFNPSSARTFSYFSRKVRDSEKSEQCELRLRGEGGDGNWVLANGTRFPGGDQNHPFMLISLTDITERKEIEADLISSEEKFSRVFHAAPAVIGIVSSDEGRFMDINNHCTEMLGYMSQEIIGRTADEVGIWKEPEVMARIKRIMEEKGHVSNMEVTLRSKKGDQFTTLLSADFIEISGERHILIVLRDITERIRTEEEIRTLNSLLEEKAAKLDEANRELDAFNYAVAHDLLNHLNILNIHFQVMSETCRDNIPQSCNGYFDEMNKSVLRMEAFIHSMLDFSRLSSRELERTELNISDLALEIALTLKAINPLRRIELRIEEDIEANGDHTLIRVVLENLIGNAFKYTVNREKAVIAFGVREKEGERIYYVEDNGEGFDMAFADRLFTPFERLPGNVKAKGSGIGLATVERIVHRHGGMVWGESEPGKGATFFFTLGERKPIAGDT